MHKNPEETGLFNFHKTSYCSSENYVLTESRFFINQKMNQSLVIVKDYIENKYTKSCSIFNLHLSPESNYLECDVKPTSFSDGIWTIVNEYEGSHTNPIKNEDIYKIGRQAIKMYVLDCNSNVLRMKIRKGIYEDIFNSINLENEQKFFDVEEFYSDLIFNKNDNSSSRQGSHSSSTRGCRICLETEKTNNPFAEGLCQCCTSIPVHVSCLISWNSAKYKKELTENVSYYDLVHIACEFCKKAYPKFMKLNNQMVPSIRVDFPVNEKVLIIVIHEIAKTAIRYIIVIKISDVKDQELSIGCASDASLKFTDSTISMKHAVIKIKNQNAYMFNIDKKYGTLKKIGSKIDLNFLHEQVIVMNRFTFLIHVFRTKECCSFLKKAKNQVKLNPIFIDERVFLTESRTTLTSKQTEHKFQLKSEQEITITHENIIPTQYNPLFLTNPSISGQKNNFKKEVFNNESQNLKDQNQTNKFKKKITDDLVLEGENDTTYNKIDRLKVNDTKKFESFKPYVLPTLKTHQTSSSLQVF